MPQTAAIFYPAHWPLEYLHGTLDELYRVGIYDGCRMPADGAVIVDAGANIGQVARAFVPIAGHIHAIEADPDIFAVLERNREHNEWANVTAHHFALAAHDGEATLYRCAANPFGGSISYDWAEEEVTVPAKRLDTFMAEQNLEHIHLLKLDVEGAEGAIIADEAFGDLARRIDNIVVECHWDHGRPVVARLKALGYLPVRPDHMPPAIHAFTRASLCRRPTP